MNRQTSRKQTALLLGVIGLLYFLAFVAPNARGAASEHSLKVFSGDEHITYPYVVHMLTPAADRHELAWRLFIYGDYHYGYPFYFASMLAVLPVRLVFGAGFVEHMQLNLLLLRQMVSVLPMVLAVLIMVYLYTGFRNPLRSVFLFLFLLFVPGIVRNNLWWWHPDAMSVLSVTLTLLFLTLDRLRMGRFFFLAAAACGLAVGIKLVGFFFVFLLAGYVFTSWRRIKIPLLFAAGRALLFIAIMAVVVMVSNPFLFYASQREKLFRIQSEKTQELSHGYTHDNPAMYTLGPSSWVDTLEEWYGPVPFLLLLVGLTVLGSFSGDHKLANRLVLAWIIPYSIYLLYFVAVKPDHYWLPVMIPLFASGLNWLDLPIPANKRGLHTAAAAAFGLLFLWQAGMFLIQDIAQYSLLLAK